MNKFYHIEDSWDWVTHFEKEVANYCGSKYAIAVDSNSNALRLLLHYLNIKNSKIEIPSNTYVSVPNQIILSGNIPVFKDIKWSGMYELGDTSVVDAATAFYENMYINDTYMVLSFHLKKIIKIGKGGMILTNDEFFNEWARPMIYDGRHKYKLYDSDEFECIGWHMYMTPEDAKFGLTLLKKYIDSNDRTTVCGGSDSYKDLRKQKIFEKWI
jgi:dTDP-4-amino-4,6-dideoxygalactose transaminase